MGEHGEAACRADQRDCLGGSELLALGVRGAVAADEALERLLERLDVPSLQQRLGDVWPADRRLAGDLLNARPLDRRTEALQRLDDPPGAIDSPFAERTQALLQRFVRAVDEEAEDVYLCARHVAG